MPNITWNLAYAKVYHFFWHIPMYRSVFAFLAGACCVLCGYAQGGIHPSVGGVQESQESVELVELWLMGDSEDDDVLFRYIQDVAVDSRNRVYAADYGHKALSVFSDTGALLLEIGRAGQGPGEFESVNDVFVGAADTIFVWDFNQRRVSTFAPDGYGIVETVAVQGGLNTIPHYLIGVTADAFVFGYIYGLKDGEDNQATRGVDVHLVDRKSGVILDHQALARFPDMSQLVDERKDGSISVTRMPFRGKPQLDVSLKGHIYLAHGEASTVAVASAEGVVLDTIKWSFDPVPVTSSDYDDAVKGRSKRYRSLVRDRLPKTKPAFQQLVVDDQERLWLQQNAPYGASVTTCVILKSDGTHVDTVDIPVNLHLWAVRNDRAYGVLTAEDGKQMLVAYAIK